MKPHPLWPQLVLLSLSVFSLLGLSPVASALALPPPTARHDQKSLQAISNNVHDTHGVDTASGIKTFLDDLITAPTVIEYIDIPVAVSPPPTSSPNTGCTTSKSTKSILKTFVSTAVKATKSFPSTLYNFITATHPERHPHLARRAGAKRDLNQEDPKLSEAVDYAGKILVNTGKGLLWFVEAWAESKCLFCSDSGPEKRELKHEDGEGLVKRDLNGMNEVNEVNEVNEMNEMNKDDAKLKEPIEKAAEIIEMIGDFVLHAFLEVLKAFKMF